MPLGFAKAHRCRTGRASRDVYGAGDAGSISMDHKTRTTITSSSDGAILGSFHGDTSLEHDDFLS